MYVTLDYLNIAIGHETNLNVFNTVLKHYFYTTRVLL